MPTVQPSPGCRLRTTALLHRHNVLQRGSPLSTLSLMLSTLCTLTTTRFRRNRFHTTRVRNLDSMGKRLRMPPEVPPFLHFNSETNIALRISMRLPGHRPPCPACSLTPKRGHDANLEIHGATCCSERSEASRRARGGTARFFASRSALAQNDTMGVGPDLWGHTLGQSLDTVGRGIGTA